MQEQQGTGRVRGAGDVLVLYGLNVVLAVLMDPPLPLLCIDMCVYVCVCVQGSTVVCVCAIVRFIVNSRGIRGRFHLSVLIIGESDLLNCPRPGNRLSSTRKTRRMVSAVGL